MRVDGEEENERQCDETPSSGHRLEVKGVAFHRLAFHGKHEGTAAAASNSSTED